MKKGIIFLSGITFLMLIIYSCKKEDGGSSTKAVFSYVADGFRVNFTNFSHNATEYVWDFGDGTESSTNKSPVHFFTQKGDYLVSLTAKNGDIVSTFIDTVSIIGPNIKIDGDFSDWEYVEYAHTNEPQEEGTLRAIKTFSTSTNINVYLEGNADMNLAVLDVYINSDNNPTTGHNTWMYPAGSAANYLLEGSVPGAWGDVFKHSGPQGDWSWNVVDAFSGVIHFSAIKTVSSKKVVEFSILKSKLGTLNQAVHIAIIESNEGWTPIGSIPTSGLATSKLLKVDL